MKLFTLRNTFATFGNHRPQTFCTLGWAMSALSNAADELVEAKHHAKFDDSEETVLVKRPSAVDPKERAWEQTLFDRAVRWSLRNGITSDGEGAFLPVGELSEAYKTWFAIEINFTAEDPLLLTELCFNNSRNYLFRPKYDEFEDFLAVVERGISDEDFDLQVLQAVDERGNVQVGIGINNEMLLRIGTVGSDVYEESGPWLENRAADVVAELYAWANSHDPRKEYGISDELQAATLAALAAPFVGESPKRLPGLRPDAPRAELEAQNAAIAARNQEKAETLADENMAAVEAKLDEHDLLQARRDAAWLNSRRAAVIAELNKWLDSVDPRRETGRL